ncbi:MAG TPA: Ig-like domain-containing protein [Candidatus Paceibacterota bacterium]|nr:Ig-like domain-containing protein [Candidatus Paceibacterota bacterium]
MKGILLYSAALVFCFAAAATPAYAATLIVSTNGYSSSGYGYNGSQSTHLTSALNTAFGGSSNITKVTNFDSSTLSNYSAVMIDLGSTNGGSRTALSATEVTKLNAFIASGGRVFMIGENSSWSSWNDSLMSLVGGTISGSSGSTYTPSVSNSLTSGITSVYVASGSASSGGTSLFNNGFAMLWGASSNVLSVLDLNMTEDDGYWSNANNSTFVTNIANWLAGSSPNPDSTSPQASTTAPAIGAYVGGTAVRLTASSTDNTAVAGVTFYVNGVKVGSEVTSTSSSPYFYSTTWNSTATTSGPHSFVAVARDTSNNYATSTSASFTVDNNAPSVSLTAPSSGASVSGAVALSATASDAGAGMAGVTFYVNGVRVGSEVTGASPYSATWDSTATSSGSKSIVAVARDAVGNYATSTPAIAVTLSNTPGPTSVAVAPDPTTLSATITWTTPSLASSRVFFGPTTTYASSTPETNTSPRVTSHSVRLTDLPPCTVYHYVVVGTNASTETSTSSDATFTTEGCTGSAAISATNASSITAASGGSVSQGALTLTVPASFTATSSAAVFQANQLDSSSFFSGAGKPSGVSSVGTTVFNLKALTDATTTLSTFASALTVTLSYTADDIAGIEETSLKIYRYDGSTWHALSNCSVDTGAKTVTCDTTAFSDFALFGTASASQSSGSSGRSRKGGSIQSQYENLLAMGETENAAALQKEWPQFLGSPVAQVPAPMQSPADAPAPASVAAAPAAGGPRDLSIGMSGDDVRALQEFLIAQHAGPSGAELVRVGATGYFGSYTRNALGEYQKVHGIAPHAGYFGPITRSYIEKNPSSAEVIEAKS